MKSNISFLSLLFLFSCASSNDFSQEVLDIKRVEIKQKSYTKPQVFVGDYKFSKRKNHRTIASLTSTPAMTNREAYFLSFYKQHLTLAKTLRMQEEQVNCPSFHNLILEHKRALFKTKRNYSTDISLSNIASDYSQVSHHPVLAVPYSGSTDLFTRLHQTGFKDTKKDLTKALSHFYQQDKRELAQLCETGVSQNYYIYENLVTYFKNKPHFHRTKEGLLSILKVPVVSKMMILDNLTNEETYINSNPFDKWLVDKAGLSWIEEFRNDLKKKRSQQIGFNQKVK